MKKFGLWICSLSLLLVFCVPRMASAWGVEAAIGGWQQDPSGDISYQGDSLSLEDELKYDSQTKVFGRVKIDMPLFIPNIYLMATPMEFDGKGRTDDSFTFGDNTYLGNVPFTSKVKLDHYDIGFYYGLPFLKTATLDMFNVELGLDVRIIDFEAEIHQSATDVNESKSLTFPLPMVYVGAQFNPIKYFSIEAEARGIAYSGNHYYDLIGRVKVKPFGPLFIGAGYRYEAIKIDDEEDVTADIDFAGPFLELGVQF